MYNIRLDNNWVEYLTKKPETGMGYQIADIKLDNGRWYRNVVISNAEVLWNFPRKIKSYNVREIKVV